MRPLDRLGRLSALSLLDTEIMEVINSIGGGYVSSFPPFRPGGVAVNILACQARDRRFESDPGRHSLS